VLIGAQPHPLGLPHRSTGPVGYILTGAEVLSREGGHHLAAVAIALSYETCVPGVFGVGDVGMAQPSGSRPRSGKDRS
jgi:thioredoxin reductase (NADPH)